MDLRRDVVAELQPQVEVPRLAVLRERVEPARGRIGNGQAARCRELRRTAGLIVRVEFVLRADARDTGLVGVAVPRIQTDDRGRRSVGRSLLKDCLGRLPSTDRAYTAGTRRTRSARSPSRLLRREPYRVDCSRRPDSSRLDRGVPEPAGCSTGSGWPCRPEAYKQPPSRLPCCCCWVHQSFPRNRTGTRRQRRPSGTAMRPHASHNTTSGRYTNGCKLLSVWIVLDPPGNVLYFMTAYV